MAKQEKLSFMQLPTPKGQTSYTSVKYDWSGLNRRQTVDTGMLSEECNISTLEAPYIIPSQTREDILNEYYTAYDDNRYEKPVAMFAFDDFLIVIKSKNGKLKLEYIKLDENGKISSIYIGNINSDVTDKVIRSMVQFNLYSSVNDVTDGQYVKKLLLFPDKKSMFFNIIEVSEAPTYTSGMELNAMYCYVSASNKKYYYIWKDYNALSDTEKDTTAMNNGGKFVLTGSADEFELEDLDVDITDYYNDGYTKTNDKYYSSKDNKTYYERSYNSSSKKYEYTEKTDLQDKSDVSGYYEKETYKDGYVKSQDTSVKSNKTYYEKNGNEFAKVTPESAANPSKTGLYEYITDYYPPDNLADTSCYMHNTYDNNIYRYTSDDGQGGQGWRVSVSPAFPDLKYAAVHLSRLCGVDDERVYVSGFNDYTNWNLDTVSDSNESNAWCSAAQSNTKADGSFTGITAYDNHIVCFKDDFMHEVYNNKNPFRLVDIFSEGCMDNRSIQEVDGKLIFVSKDEVKVYTGGNPKNIGYNLGIDRFDMAVSGSDGRNYYLFCVSGQQGYFFVYDTFIGQWSRQDLPKWENGTTESDILYFAHNQRGMYMLTDDGKIYKLDTKDYYSIPWSFETDLSTALTSSSTKTVNIKHIRKIQLYAYIPSGSTMKIYGLYDEEAYNADSSHLLFDSAKDGRHGKFPIRIKPKLTANYGFKLHFEGTGYVRVHSMEIYKTQGGELFE